jgi:tetratricopeptide (TPR) repeat protein
MKLTKKIIIISGLLNINMFANDSERYITVSELKEILKDYVRKDGKALVINKKKLKLFNKTLKGASVSAILNKIKYLYKIRKYEDIKYRCEYIEEYLTLKANQKESYYYYYAQSLSKLNLEDKAIIYFNKLLELENKSISNMEVLKYMLEVYKKLDNLEKIKEIENIIY